MEETNFVLLWKEHYQKIEENLSLNKRILTETLFTKASSALSNLKAVRWLGIVFGIIWCIGIGVIVISSWSHTSWFFTISLLIHLATSATAAGLYIYHLNLLKHFDNSRDVIAAQQKLTALKVSNLKTLGISWLQLPVFSTWFMTTAWMRESPLTFWGIQVPIVLLQAGIGIWLYRNLNYKNHHKKWFKWFVSKGEFAKIERANNLMKEIAALKQ